MDQEALKRLLTYNPKTGEFTRLKGAGKGAAAGAVTKGCIDKSNGYRRICVQGKQRYAHRVAWLYMTGQWPEDQIDHKNMDRSDNRFDNLRQANNSENNQRSRARSDSQTQVLGVSLHKKAGKYIAQIRHQGQSRYLGLHNSIESAVSARQAAELQLHTHHRSAA